LIITLILFSFIKSSIAQNPFWIKKDKILIHKFGKVYINTPNKIPSLCKIDIDKVESHRHENLGFGYKRIKGGKAGGYAGIKAEFYFYQDSLIGYTIFPNLPNKKKLRSKYQKWYQTAFNIKDEISSVYHNSEIMHQPLEAYSGNLNIEELDMNIRFYFSLQSGITYGFRGSASNSIIKNRTTFIKLVDKGRISKCR